MILSPWPIPGSRAVASVLFVAADTAGQQGLHLHSGRTARKLNRQRIARMQLCSVGDRGPVGGECNGVTAPENRERIERMQACGKRLQPDGVRVAPRDGLRGQASNQRRRQPPCRRDAHPQQGFALPTHGVPPARERAMRGQMHPCVQRAGPRIGCSKGRLWRGKRAMRVPARNSRGALPVFVTRKAQSETPGSPVVAT